MLYQLSYRPGEDSRGVPSSEYHRAAERSYAFTPATQVSSTRSRSPRLSGLLT